MIWLASFPRSGNTFARNVLFQVYGMESTEVNTKSLALTSTHEEFPVVKTHLLPEQVRPFNSTTPVICLVRDGRDALVSMAFHRSNIVEPGSDFNENLELAIQAQKGSYFGGWHINVLKWILKADLVIRFEDLTNNPIIQFERLRDIYPLLHQPDETELPTFESQKFGSPKYGPPKGKNLFFRKGRIGDWKENMSDDFHTAFWKKCGPTMELLGYNEDGTLSPLPDLGKMKTLAKRELRKKTPLMEKVSHIYLNIQPKQPKIKKAILNPKLIYFSCLNIRDPLIEVLKAHFGSENIGLVNASDPQSLILDPEYQTDPNKIEILVSTAPISLVKSHYNLSSDPVFYTWVIPPDEMIVRKYLSSQSDTLIEANSLLEDEAFLTFSKKYENRNAMNRVISKHNAHLEHADTGWQFPVLENIISSCFNFDHKIDIHLSPENITLSDELSSEILRYNKRDLDLFKYCQQLNAGHDLD